MSDLLTKEDKEKLRMHINRKRGMGATVSTTKPPVRVKSDSGFLKPFLMVTACLLSFVMITMLAAKVTGDMEPRDFAYAQPQQPQYYQYPRDDYTPPIQRDRSENIARGEIEKLNAKVDRLDHRLWVLGVQANQNTSLNKEVDRQFHRGQRANRYVYINRDWTLSQRPDNIEFSPEELERLERHVK